jgi:hypothetical protein
MLELDTKNNNFLKTKKDFEAEYKRIDMFKVVNLNNVESEIKNYFIKTKFLTNIVLI